MIHIRQILRARACHRLCLGAALAGALLAVSSTAPGASAPTVGGATPPGQFSVSSTGAATYYIPIRVSPGIGGIAPNLGLSYSSQAAGGDGLMGMAWNLTGLSSIERCPRTVAQDGARGSVNFDDNDRYCLDGQRLMLVSGTYGQDGAEYRTEIDNFSKVIGSGRAGNGTASFKVWTKSGVVQEYGVTADARIEAVYAPGTTPTWPTTTVRVWALNKVSDAKGNYLTVSYNKDAVNGVYSPARIDYAANSTANTAPQNSVVFSYIPTTNPIPKFRAGAITKRIALLSEISMYSQNTVLLRKTLLSYQSASSTLMPRLTSIQNCDASGNCLLPLNMEYPPETTGFSSSAKNWPLPSIPNIPNGQNYTDASGATSISMPDLNGDGLPDLYVTSLSAGQKSTAYLNTGFGFSSVGTSWPFPSVPNIPNVQSYTQVESGSTAIGMVDLNGDGLPDLYITSQSAGLKSAVYFNTASGFSNTAASWAFPSLPNIPNVQNYSTNGSTAIGLMDLNGDGLPDLYVTSLSAGLKSTVYLNTGFGFSGVGTTWPLPSFPNIPNVQNYTTNGSTAISLVDLNGDGLPDLYITSASAGLQSTVYFNTGLGFSNVATTWPFPSFPNIPNVQNYTTDGSTAVGLVDLNGDGLPDLYVTSASAGGSFVYWNTGTGFSSTATKWAFPSVPNIPNVQHYTDSSGSTTIGLADLDGDGLPDLYVTGYSKAVYFNQSQPQHLLTQVSNASGTSTRIKYGHLSDPTLYTKDSDANKALYPKVDLQSSIPVVATIDNDNGIGSTNSIKYSYGGLKREAGTGRELLGFRWIKSNNLTNGVEQYGEVNYEFPYTGLLLKSETRLAGSGNAGILKRTTYASACHLAASGAACAATPGAIYFPYLSSAVDESWDLNGASLPGSTSSVQFNTFPHYGDPSVTNTVTTDGIGKSTAFTYWPADTANWVVGRVKSTVVTNTAP